MVVALASLIGDAAETYDLTNIGTLFAFALVCIGVLVLRVKEPERPRPFRVPLVWPVALLGTAACIFIMVGLPPQAWESVSASGWWSASCSISSTATSHSRLRASADPGPSPARRRPQRKRAGHWPRSAVTYSFAVLRK